MAIRADSACEAYTADPIKPRCIQYHAESGGLEDSMTHFAMSPSERQRAGTSSWTSAVDLAMMRQPLHLSYPYLQYGKTTGASALTNTISSHVPLPVPHSTLSRVVVNAIGRLGRWKRVLNYRTTNTRAPLRPPETRSGHLRKAPIKTLPWVPPDADTKKIDWDEWMATYQPRSMHRCK